MARNIELGRRGEQIAAAYLTSAGHRVVDRNWRSATGELDLVTIDAGTVVAVEVKTRSGTGYGHPLEAIDERKLHRLHRLALEWCASHRMRRAAVRVDAVAILIGSPTQPPTVEHLRGVR